VEPSQTANPENQAERKSYLRELFANQLWQGANFAAKAAFLVVLTPLMLDRWGKEQYGLFALASSLLVSMALLDGGVRNLTRLRMVSAARQEDETAYRRHFAEGVLTFASVVVVASVFLAALAWTGCLTEWLRLPPNGAAVLVVTAALTGSFMVVLFGLEPLAAANRLSVLKAANTWGALAAMPVVAVAVWFGASVLTVMVLYSACLIIPTLFYMVRGGVLKLRPWAFLPQFGPGTAFRTLRDGRWFYLTTVALILKTHALTFLISAMAGPAEAGLFYILLRLTEIIGNVGSTASETSLAALASAPDEAGRGRNFRHSWMYVVIFSVHAALGLLFLGRHALDLWLGGSYVLASGAMAAMAVFGLAGGFSRVVVNASMGLHEVRPAALANLAESALDVVCAAIGFYFFGLPGVFLGGCVGLLCLVRQAAKITRRFDRGVTGSYLQPAAKLVPGFLIAGAVLAAAGATPWIGAWGGAVLLTAILAGWQIRSLHRSA
jgi:O-antigen/teichoic acid export membrane protein